MAARNASWSERTAALFAALALAIASVQVGILSNCNLCPADCPMHAESGHDHGSALAKTKPRCHSGGHHSASDETRITRPPCRTTITLAGSPLPPFVLHDLGPSEQPIDPDRPDHQPARLTSLDAAPDTPPPVLAV